MKIKLFHRNYGIHSFIKEIEVDLKFGTMVKKSKNPNDGFTINEEAILESIPKRWLPVKPENILLTVGDKHGSTAQRRPKKFRGWGKYFDGYCLELCK